MPRRRRKERASIGVSCYVTAAQFHSVNSAASLEGISFAEFVRGLIDDWLDENPELDRSDEIEMVGGLAGISRMTMDRRESLRQGKKRGQVSHAIQGWPSGVEWRTEPPRGSAGLDLEVDVWLQEARGLTNNLHAIDEFPGNEAFERVPGTPVDEWQSRLRAALGLSPQPEDVKEAV